MNSDEVFERVQAFISGHWPLVGIAAGLFFLLGAILNWNWLCDPKGTRSAYSIFGRTGRRIAFGIVGAVLIIVGVWMLFV